MYLVLKYTMAIKKTLNNSDKITLDINNGDLTALKEVIEKFKFKDEEAALRYSLYALLRTDTTGLVVEEEGKMFRLEPTSKVINLNTNGSKKED